MSELNIVRLLFFIILIILAFADLTKGTVVGLIFCEAILGLIIAGCWVPYIIVGRDYN